MKNLSTHLMVVTLDLNELNSLLLKTTCNLQENAVNLSMQDTVFQKQTH